MGGLVLAGALLKRFTSFQPSFNPDRAVEQWR
jgi:hypothetical protein